MQLPFPFRRLFDFGADIASRAKAVLGTVGVTSADPAAAPAQSPTPGAAPVYLQYQQLHESRALSRLSSTKMAQPVLASFSSSEAPADRYGEPESPSKRNLLLAEEGWMFKTPSGFGPLLRPSPLPMARDRRYFVLRGCELKWFRTEADARLNYSPRETINLCGYTVRQEAGLPYTFALFPKGDEFALAVNGAGHGPAASASVTSSPRAAAAPAAPAAPAEEAAGSTAPVLAPLPASKLATRRCSMSGASAAQPVTHFKSWYIRCVDNESFDRWYALLQLACALDISATQNALDDSACEEDM